MNNSESLMFEVSWQQLKQELIEEVINRALEFGDFLLASGQRSSFYLQCRRLTLSTGMLTVAKALDKFLTAVDYDAVGGMETGVNQIVGGFLTYCASVGIEKRGFVALKEAKKHGKIGDLIVGSVRKGDRCVLVEDVATTGQSMMRAIDRLVDFGCPIVQAVAIVDRNQGAKELLSQRGIPFSGLINLEDLGIKP